MNDDKLQCVLAVTSTLRQLIQSLRSTPNILADHGARHDGPIPVGERNGEVTFTECADFIDLVASLVVDAEGNFEELQGILLNTDPTLIPTLVAVVTIAPAILGGAASAFPLPPTGGGSPPPTPFEKLVLSSLQCLLRIATVGCVDVYDSPQRTRDGGHAVNDPANVPLEGKRTSELLGAMLKRTDLGLALLALADVSNTNPTTNNSNGGAPLASTLVRFGCAKLLFTATLRVPAVKASIAQSQQSLEQLLEATLGEENAKIRSYHAGTAREIAGSHPIEVTESDENIRSLARLFSTDPLSDVRAMAAESLDIIYRNQPQRWRSCGAKRDVSTAIIGQLEAAASGGGEGGGGGGSAESEALVAVLRLLETLLIADAALSFGKPQTSGGQSSSFTQLFAAARGERSLIVAIRGTTEADSLAARCLRLLTEFAPHHCEVPYNIARHFPTIAVVLKAVVALASDRSDATFVADMRFELSLAVAMVLCQDPRARRLLSEELRRNPAWMNKLRGSLLSNLNYSSLSDFAGIRLIDVTGDNLSDIRNVQWEEEAQRPSRDSLESFMAEQFYRLSAYEGRGGHAAAVAGYASGLGGGEEGRDVPLPDPNGESLETRLTFVILTNTIHNTFHANKASQNAKALGTSGNLSSADDHNHGASSSGQRGQSPSHSGGAGLLADLGVADGSASPSSKYRRRQAPATLETLLGGGGDYREGSHGSDGYNSAAADSVLINQLSRVDKSVLRGAAASAQQRHGEDSYYPTAGPVPGQTRTSLIREWKNNPKKLEAIKAMARHSHAAHREGEEGNHGDSATRPANFVGGGRGGRGGGNGGLQRQFASSASSSLPPAPTATAQYRSNFVDSYLDPFKEPTRDSFKRPPKPTVGQMVAANNSSTKNNNKATDGPKYLTKFDAALRLCERVGQHYMPMSEVIEAAVAAANAENTTVFETTGDGFAKRRFPALNASSSKHSINGKNASSSSMSAAIARRAPKTWCVDDLREGDLFYFAVPLSTLSAFAVDQVRIQAVRHLNHLKRSYIVVPNNMKGRRWFIFDMSTHVMPHVIAALDDVLELMEAHGEQNCRFPLLMFKEDGGAAAGMGIGGFAGNNNVLTAPDAVPAATLNSGNLFESLDQLRFYFSKMAEVNPVAASAAAGMSHHHAHDASHAYGGAYDGSSFAAAGAGATSQHLADLESKINALKNREFQPRTDAKFMHAFGGGGPSAVMNTSFTAAAADGAGDDDDEYFDEMRAVPPSSAAHGYGAHGRFVGSAHAEPDFPPSLSATRARAMLIDDGTDEIDGDEPLGRQHPR